jgi:hypothetical protein
LKYAKTSLVLFQGYVFNKTKHEEGRFPVCEDKNECSEDNGGKF